MGKQSPTDQKKTLKELRDLADSLQRKMQNVGDEGSKSFKKIEDQVKSLTDKISKTKDALSDTKDRLSALPDELSYTGQIIEQQVTRRVKQLTETFDAGTISAEQLNAELLEMDGHLTNAANGSEALKNALGGSFNQINAITDIIAAPFDKLVNSIGKLPFGDKLLQAMEADKIGNEFKIKVGAAVEKSVVTGKLQFMDFAKAGGQAIKELAGKFKMFGGVFLLIAGLALLALNRFRAMDKVMADIRDKTGLTREGMARIAEQARIANVNLQEYGISMENAAESAMAINEIFGNLSFITQDNIEFISLLSKRLGVGAGEAVKMYQAFLNMTGGSADLAQSMIKTTIAAADLVDVAPQLVFQDIANASERIFEVTDGLPDTIARTAIEARRLGLNLDAALGIAESLMSFESSIEGEMNAMVLTGRQLNLEQARYFAAVGETDKMLGEISKQFGDIEEFSRLLPFQQKALAQTIGLSAGQLRNMLSTQKQLKDLGDGTVSTFEAFQKGASFEDVLKTKDILTPLEELNNSFKTMMVSLAEVLLPVIKMLAPLLKVVIGLFMGIADVMRIVFIPFQLIGDMLEKLVGGSENFATTLEWVGKVLGWIGGIALVVFGIMALPFAAIPLLITAIVAAVGIAIKLIYDYWDDIVGFFSGWYSLLYDNLIQPFVDAWDWLFGNTIWSADNIAAIFGEILAVLRVVGNAIIDILILPFEIVWERIKGIFSGIGDMISGTIGAVASIFGGGGASAPAVAGGGVPAAAGAIAGAGAAPIPVATAGGTPVTLQDVVDKLEALINVLTGGVDLKLQGAKVGEILAKDARK